MVSFKLSKASVTLFSSPSVVKLPSPNDESVGVPIVTLVPTVDELDICEST